MQRVLLIFAAMAVIACGAKSTTAPITANVTGSWSGPISDALLGSGTLSLSLTQFGDSVTGSWSTSFPNASDDLLGQVMGTISGSTIAVLLKPFGGSTCQYGPFNLTATESVTGSLSGTFMTAYNCSVPDSGTYSAVKQ